MFLLKTCLTITKIIVHSGASIQENQNKERNTMTNAMNYIKKKQQTAVKSTKKEHFPFQTYKFLKESLHMFDTRKIINEQCNRICCSKKQDNGAYNEPKQ